MDRIDLSSLGVLTVEHAGGLVLNVLGMGALGLLIALVIVFVYHKLGLFKRPGYKWYGRLVMLYIPAIVVVCVFFGGQIGLYRSIHRAVSELNDEVVASIYDRGVSPYIGTTEQKQALVTALAAAYGNTRNVGDAVGEAIKAAVHRTPPENRNMAEKVSAYVVDELIDHYRGDIAAAVIYGIYATGGDRIGAHRAGEPIPYEVFKGALDQLLKADVRTVEAAVKGNLSGVVQLVIDGQYRAFRNETLLVAGLLLLIPVLDWALFKLFARKKPEQAPTVLRADDVSAG